MAKYYKLVYVGLHPPKMHVEGPGLLPVDVDMALNSNDHAFFLNLLDKVYEAGFGVGCMEWRIPSVGPKPNAPSPQPEAAAVNPDHYKVGGIECIDYLKAKLSAEELRGFLKGNAIKYLSRAEQKGHAEDYAKANWYTTMLSGKDPRTS